MEIKRVLEVRLTNFKAFEKFRAQTPQQCVLVGPNNAGKSTLISSLRAGARVLSNALARKPQQRDEHRGKHVISFAMPRSIGIDTANIRHEFREAEVSIDLVFSGRNQITLVWPTEASEIAPFAYLRPADRAQPTRPKDVQGLYPSLGLIPVLTPLEVAEASLTEEHVRANYENPTTSRHGRNHLAHLKAAGELEEFLQFARPWMAEVEVGLVRTQMQFGESRVDVFFTEKGFHAEKEIAWLGDGMQVWLQLLLHLYRLRNHDVIILDEPDVYLHADLKRRLVRLLESLPGQFIMASHSSEILAEVDQSSILYIDRSQRAGIRARDPSRLEVVSRSLGSGFNLRMAKALRARLLLFVEGEDMRLITLAARQLGLNRLANEEGLAPIPLGGFDAWREARGVIELMEDLLAGLPVFVILDRDYRSDAEREDIVARLTAESSEAHVWERKELENYMLHPRLIAKVTGVVLSEVESLLDACTQAIRNDVFGNFVQQRQIERGRHVAAGTIAAEILPEFDAGWADMEWRLRRAGGKDIMREFNKVSDTPINPRSLARNSSLDVLDHEFVDILQRIEQYLA